LPRRPAPPNTPPLPPTEGEGAVSVPVAKKAPVRRVPKAPAAPSGDGARASAPAPTAKAATPAPAAASAATAAPKAAPKAVAPARRTVAARATRGAPAPEAAVSAPPPAAPTRSGAGASAAADSANPVWLRPAVRDDRAERMLYYALAVSIVLHAVVLAVKFQPFDLKKMLDRGPPLEVALVNAKTKAKPTKADILAQANLDGGGNTDADRRAKSPLPVLPKDSPNNEISVATQKVRELEQAAKELMTQLKSTPTAPAQPKPTEAAEPSPLPSSTELMQRTLEAMKLEAQIAKDMDAYQKRPKRRFVGARAEEYRFARYVEDWRLKIERIGNLNYPEAARQLKLYGNLLITVSIKSDGSLEAVEINRSSGQRVLDAAAVKIVEMSAPFSAFPPDIKRDTDILHITRTWTFTKGDELVSQ
jgi:protein TonB